MPVTDRGIIGDLLSRRGGGGGGSDTSGFPVFDHGVHDSGGATGWQSVRFNKTFSSMPTVIATQTSGSAAPRTQGLTPPKIGLRGIPRISLASLQRTVPDQQVSWGDQAKRYVVDSCAGTIGRISVVGGYLCAGIDATFGELLRIVFDAIQSIYYAFDAKALVESMANDVEAKTLSDWNRGINSLQAALNSIVDDVNTAMGSFAEVTQGALNSIWPLIAEAHGLGGESLPIVKVESVGLTGFSVLSSGAPVHWIAIQGGR